MIDDRWRRSLVLLTLAAAALGVVLGDRLFAALS
jgi:hypothetical protein